MYVMKQTGWIELICGSMFSGKSEELIKRVSRAQFAKQKIAVFKPSLDNRYAKKLSYRIMVFCDGETDCPFNGDIQLYRSIH